MLRGVQVIISSSRVDRDRTTIIGRLYNQSPSQSRKFVIENDERATPQRASGTIRRCPLFRGKTVQARQLTADRLSLIPLK